MKTKKKEHGRASVNLLDLCSGFSSVFTFYYSPRIQPSPHFLATYFNKSVAPYHSKWHASLKTKTLILHYTNHFK